MTDNTENETTGQSAAAWFEAISGARGVLGPWFVRVQALAAGDSGFATHYGPFPDSGQVKDFGAALDRSRELAQRWGGPAALKRQMAEAPDFLFGSEPPEKIYAHLIWVAVRIKNAASTFRSTLEGLKPMTKGPGAGHGPSAQELKTVLAGSGGLTETAGKTRIQIQAVKERIDEDEPLFHRSVRALVTTDLLDQANEAIGTLQSTLARLQRQAVDAHRKWTGRNPPVRPAEEPNQNHEAEGHIRSFWPWERKKENARKTYERLSREITATRAAIEEKIRLVHDLKGFFPLCNRVIPAVLDTQNGLNRLEGQFKRAGDRLVRVCTLSGDDQLESHPWLAGALEIPAEIGRWQEMEEAARHFIQQSPVSHQNQAG